MCPLTKKNSQKVKLEREERERESECFCSCATTTSEKDKSREHDNNEKIADNNVIAGSKRTIQVIVETFERECNVVWLLTSLQVDDSIVTIVKTCLAQAREYDVAELK